MVNFYLFTVIMILMVRLFVLLTDVAEGDPDADCRNLAVQSLVLLEKSLKTEMNPAALVLQS